MVKMLNGIRNLFKKSRLLFSRCIVKEQPHSDRPSENMHELALREQFKKRFLDPYASDVASDLMSEATSPSVVGFKLAPLACPVLLIAGLTGLGPLGLLAASGIVAVRYAFFVEPRLQKAFEDASREITQTSNLGSLPGPSAIDAWMARHSSHMPDYLDRLDRREEDLRKRKKILDRLERLGSQAVTTEAEKELLKRYDPRHFRTRAENPNCLLPHVSILGNRHSTQLYNAIRKDIQRQAGRKGSLLRQMLGINRPV